MAFKSVVSINISTPSGTLARSKEYESSQVVEFDEAITVGTDRQVNATIDVSAVKVFYMVSDRTVTVQTNDGSSPDDEFVLTAGVPRMWFVDCGEDFVLTTDVTEFFITNASGGTANVKLRVLQDSTP